MRIVKIVAGSGGTFYCENCLRDAALVKALRSLGHDVLMVPMYLPVWTDDPGLAQDAPVFFGGINVYLQDRFRLFRKTPRWLDRLFDARWLLNLAARQAASTSASGLGDMTLSMLRGEDGHQAKELARLVDWLGKSERQDVVHITTVMLIGLARSIKRALGVPVICSLQDEDTWLDALRPPYDAMCWKAIEERVGDVDAFVAPSRYYADRMRARIRLPADRLCVVHGGIDLDGFSPAPLGFDPPVVGYLSKMTESLGLGDLVQAFIALKREAPLKRLRLRAMGGQTGRDRRFVADLVKLLRRNGVADDAEFIAEVDRPTRLAFLNSLSVLCVPMPAGEAFGAFILEALAAGVPAVEPRAGAFPEMVDATGGGVLYDPAAPGALTDALRSLLTDPQRALRLGRAGREAVVKRFGVSDGARNLLEVYRKAAT